MSTLIRPQPTTTVNEPSPLSIPELENGDRLTRPEFERRFDATPNLKNAELLEGIVHIPPPVRFQRHAHPHAQMVGWLGIYAAYTPGVEGSDSSHVRLDLDNMPQPDVFLMITHARGGRPGSTTMIMWPAHQSWLSRSPPAASAMTWG